MENNEETTEEVVDTSTEDVKVEDTSSDEDTKDWKAEALKFKAIADRREKKLQDSELKKPNTEQVNPTIEDMALLSKGLSLDELKVVQRASKTLDIPMMDAYEDDIVQAKIERLRQEDQVTANALPPSGGSPPAQREKTIGNMDDNEHRKLWEEKAKNAANK